MKKELHPMLENWTKMIREEKLNLTQLIIGHDSRKILRGLLNLDFTHELDNLWEKGLRSLEKILLSNSERFEKSLKDKENE